VSDHRRDVRRVVAVHLRVPVGVQTARVRLPRPHVQTPELERVVLLELLAEELGGSLAARMSAVGNDVLDRDQLLGAIRLRLVQQQLRLVHLDRAIDVRHVAVVKAHSAEARIGHARRDLRGPAGGRRCAERAKWGGDLPERFQIRIRSAAGGIAAASQ